MSAFTYPEAIFAGLVQGISELFPVSSLGHGVLLPAVIGGRWGADMSVSPDSPYLNILVAAHVGTAIALVVFFWHDWVRIVGGLFSSIRHLHVRTPDQRLAWLLVLGTIPVGIAGILLDKIVEKDLGKPVPASIFLALNGVILFAVERIQRNRAEDEDFMAALRGPGGGADDDTVLLEPVSMTEVTTPMGAVGTAQEVDAKLSRLGIGEAIGIGAAQVFALLPGVSRSGSTIVGGLLRGLRHDEAARFAFLLATPAIAGAGLFKLPELLTPQMRGSLGPALVCLVVAGVAAFVSVRFLTRYFETRTLTPFGIYCVVAGLGCLAYFTVVR